VAVQDKGGKTVRDGTYTVTLALKKTGGAKLSGALTARTVNGIATFAGAKMDAPANGCQLVASAEHLRAGTSAEFLWPEAGCGASGGPVKRIFPRRRTGRNPGPGAGDTGANRHEFFRADLRLAHRAAVGRIQIWVAGGGASELRLSSDASPTNAVKIAAVTATTPYCKWPHINERIRKS